LLQLAAKVTIKIVEAQRSADQKPTGPVEKPKRMLWAVLAIRLLLLVVLAIKIIPFELLMMKKPPPKEGTKLLAWYNAEAESVPLCDSSI